MHLFTPGPTQVPQSVLDALSRPMIHHRSSDFEEIFEKVRSGITQMCHAGDGTVFFSGSGSASMEAVTASFFEEGDEVVVVVGGKFGQRWQQLAECYNLQIKLVEVQWGKAVEVDEVLKQISKKTKAVLIQACETSSGVFHPVYELAKSIKNLREDILFVVDAITAFGIYPFDLEDDKIDVLIGGSQKALMCPPGLSFVSMKSGVAARTVDKPKALYLSVANEFKAQEKGNTAFTPPINLFLGLQAALALISEEGAGNVYKRHEILQTMSRKAFRDLGFELFNKDEDAAFGITAVTAFANFDVGKWLNVLRETHKIWLAGGQNHLKGKIFRFGHMGYCFPSDIKFAFTEIEKSLTTLLAKDFNGKATQHMDV